VSWYRNGKTNLDFTEAGESEWQWHQLGHMQVCTSRQITTPAPHNSVFYRPDAFLPPNQPRQSTEGKNRQVKAITVEVRVVNYSMYSHEASTVVGVVNKLDCRLNW